MEDENIKMKNSKKLFNRKQVIFRYSFLIIGLFLFCACSGESKEQKYNTSVSEETMSKVMRDISRARFMVAMDTNNEDVKQQMREKYKSDICLHYGLTPKQYDEALKGYFLYPNQMKDILEKSKQ